MLWQKPKILDFFRESFKNMYSINLEIQKKMHSYITIIIQRNQKPNQPHVRENQTFQKNKGEEEEDEGEQEKERRKNKMKEGKKDERKGKKRKTQTNKQ